MLILCREDTGRWFTLKVKKKNGFPLVVIKNDYIKRALTVSENIMEKERDTLDSGLKDAFPVSGCTLGEAYFGYGKTIERTRVTREETTYQINLPKIHFESQNVCPRCKGSGESEYLLSESGCSCCYGSGKEVKFDWGAAYITSLSLNFLMRILWSADTYPYGEKKERQLLEVTLLTVKGMHGGSLGGSFSPHVIRILKTFVANYQFETVEKAMRRAYRHMWGRPRYCSNRYFRAWQGNPGNVILDVPGDACGIHPIPHVQTIPEGKGIEFSCHNVDSPLQQLTLFTGLCALCDLVG